MRSHNQPVFRLPFFIATVMGALMILAASNAAYAQERHSRMTANGTGAGAFTCDQNGNCSGISVSRDQSGKSVTTNLYFRFEIRDPTGRFLTYAFGEGTIPNEDLIGDTPGMAVHNLRLNTDITKNPSFFALAVSCDGGNCTPIPLGVVSATFTKTDARTYSEHGTREERFKLPDGSSVTTRWSGSADFSSAQATANVFGIVVNFNSGEANIGTFRSATMTIDKTAH